VKVVGLGAEFFVFFVVRLRVGVTSVNPESRFLFVVVEGGSALQNSNRSYLLEYH
jgi:hypothetical protein